MRAFTSLRLSINVVVLAECASPSPESNSRMVII